MSYLYFNVLRRAAGLIDVSADTVLRRAVEYAGEPNDIDLLPCPEGKVRFKGLKLEKGTRQERRYYTPDLFLWLN